jgi:hypothetical protein
LILPRKGNAWISRLPGPVIADLRLPVPVIVEEHIQTAVGPNIPVQYVDERAAGGSPYCPIRQ